MNEKAEVRLSLERVCLSQAAAREPELQRFGEPQAGSCSEAAAPEKQS